MIVLDTNVVSELMIASIARTNQAAVATRNVRDFVDCGLKLVDPWQED